MTNINLLPWREERRSLRQREFFAMLAGAVIIGIAIWWLWSQAVTASIDNQRARNDFVQQNISKLDKQIAEIADIDKQRSQLLERMKVIQSLQGDRPNIVHIFDQLVRTLPKGVYYTSVERHGKSFTIKGVAENNNQISTLMRQLSASPWFMAPMLATVDAKGKDANAFSLTVQQAAPKTDSHAADKGGNS